MKASSEERAENVYQMDIRRQPEHFEYRSSQAFLKCFVNVDYFAKWNSSAADCLANHE